jgi:translation initiation factor IF-2
VDQSKYTQVAAQAVSLAELFDARFEQGLDGPVRCRVEMSAPDGPSTAGGKQALQHIKLVPADGSPAIVIGSANTIRRTAEIRTFDHVAAAFAQRFKGARVPLDVNRYQELSQNLAIFFRAMKMETTFADARSAGLSVPPAAGGGRGYAALFMILGAVVGLSALIMAYWAIFLRHH